MKRNAWSHSIRTKKVECLVANFEYSRKFNNFLVKVITQKVTKETKTRNEFSEDMPYFKKKNDEHVRGDSKWLLKGGGRHPPKIKMQK